MLKEIWNLSRKLIFLARDMDETKERLERLTAQVSELIDNVRELRFELAKERSDRQHENETLKLQLRLALMELGQRLPTAPPPPPAIPSSKDEE